LFVWNGTAWVNSTLPATIGDGQVLFSSGGSIAGSANFLYNSGTGLLSTSGNFSMIGANPLIDATTAGLAIRATSAGAGIAFSTGGTTIRWTISSAGVFSPNADAAYSIGNAVNQNRVSNIFVSSSVKISGATSVFEVWNTDAATSTVNYEKGVFDWQTTANTLTIGTKAAGTGTARDVNVVSAAGAVIQSGGSSPVQLVTPGSGAVQIYTGNVGRWNVSGTTGDIVPVSDATYSLGSSSGSVKQLFLSKTITAAGTTGAQTINKATWVCELRSRCHFACCDKFSRNHQQRDCSHGWNQRYHDEDGQRSGRCRFVHFDR
jgi:hypothetical protein